MAAFDQALGAPANRGVVFKVIPDNIMAGLELRRGVTDVVVNDLPPDITSSARAGPEASHRDLARDRLSASGFNMLDPVLKDVRVRRALS